ncbi:MAG: response regulator transcription factor [Firmicutes bacterium]|nr:response regulator transcription factor [Bacillota bacterium]
MKILIVDDEKGIREVIKEYSISEGYSTLEASNGIEALEKLEKNNDVDVIVLDIMMPKMDGYTTLKKIRETYNIPVIMLSARADEFDKLQSFDLGVDDYVTKPFSPKELMARIKVVTGRNKTNNDEYIYKNLKINYLGHNVLINDEEVKLTPKEYELLVYFVQNKGIALSRETLLSKIWGYDFYGDDRTIDTHIKMLRNGLGEYRNLITTVRSIGYKYEEK